MSSLNGEPIIVSGGTAGLAHYPHARLAPGGQTRTLYISGTSSRLPDGTFDGVKVNEDGSLNFDVRQQTFTIIRNIEAIIKNATAGRGNLGNIIDATIFLVDIGKNYSGMNAVWNEFWPRVDTAPARTTIGVKELPSPKIVVEFKCTALIDVDG
ncbi:hypothetical protein ACKRZS_003085 [Fusarium odoratissimum]|uniref:2-aminomuconate deaminase n=3 Tax=Fusarium oxysporum species complex TaxID=171631 RepID=N1S6Z7_FUSC4|nr:uncharacterized protein FOIG_15974 [Fusarium odoratissimum NRRL 54006]EMT73899.1 2-aminomuconate deaminase [Fusarium odoratissimum]EXL90766.1 hypothetical protein FOIG_15974 [Fusarium odoratissimum NRRL 54006]KAK2128973.1 Endoribonuclease L-PSP/chorismate mutase-like protein [Fusarium oxysporum II5]TXC05499.1 hypothetical protein FocTR4_00010871 [Fusarium oxysporum f. sp. cubense]